MYHSDLKIEVIAYRKQGYSYLDISNKFGVPKSTLSGWLKGIEFKPNLKVRARVNLAVQKSIGVRRANKLKSIILAKQTAKKELGSLSRRDLWLLGIGMYIGEGAKSIENVRIINSDPLVIKTAVHWLKDICGLTNKNLSLFVHTYPDNDIRATIRFWSKVTGIPVEQFGKTQIDRRIGKLSRNRGKLPYGTVQLRVRAGGEKEFGVFLHRRIMGWIEVIGEQIQMRD